MSSSFTFKVCRAHCTSAEYTKSKGVKDSELYANHIKVGIIQFYGGNVGK